MLGDKMIFFRSQIPWPALPVIFIFAAAFSGCQPPTQITPEIRIGVITYNKADDIERISTINAATMAVEEVNENGGITLDGKKHRISWIQEDVRGAVPEESVEATKKLINQENVIAIIGPQYSTDAIPAGEVAENSNIPLISPISTNPKTTLDRSFVFRMGFLDEFQGHVAASFTRQQLRASRAGVIYNIANPYSRGIARVFRDHFEHDGGTIVAFESYTTEQVDFSGQLAKIKNSDPEVLYLPNFSEETKLIVIQARKMGINVRLMGGDGWDRADFSKMREFDGAYTTAHYSEQIQSEKNRDFVNSYKGRFDLVPGDTAALTYDAFHLVFEAIKFQGKADPQSVRDGLYALGPFEGVGGNIDFVENGDPVKGAVILQFNDKEIKFVRIVNPE